jgi:hypothetical protein
MFRISTLLLAAFLVAPVARAELDIQDIKFGILRQVSPDEYRMDVETVRIPRKLKDTGFRFGIEFRNPRRDHIQWFEVVYLPEPLVEASGNTRKVAPQAIQTDKYSSTDELVVDHFWFDPGDPLGHHRLELYVNGKRRYNVEFEVVPE